ncbi:MAG: acyl-CoA thioesterase [Lentisphaeria bacterium]|nr:acyl-CoA thioesterase [Lentisphaeria bacterium]
MRHPEFKQYFERIPGGPPPLEVSVTRRLQFSESDPLKIAWHGNYAKFFEAAYTELSHSFGFDNDRLEEEHVSALFYHDEYDYRIPLPCDAVFHTSAVLIWTDAPRINIEYAVRLEDGRVAATGCTTQVFIDARDFTPLWHIPAFWEEFLNRWKEGAYHHG